MDSSKIQSIENYFVAAKVVVTDDDGRMLTMLRGKSAPTNPLHWDLPGGILEYGEALDVCAIRETKEEAAIEIDTPRVFHAIARMNSIGEFWTTVYFAARALSQDVTLSWEHDEYKWVFPEEYVTMTVPRRIQETMELYIEMRDRAKIWL